MKNGAEFDLGKKWADREVIATIDLRVSGVVVFEARYFEEVEQKVQRLDSRHQESRMFMRTFLGFALQLDANQEGKIHLPVELVHAAGVGKRSVINDKATYLHIAPEIDATTGP